MPFTGNFSASQLASLSQLQIIDTSSGGTDSNINSRKIFLYKVDGTTLVPTGTTTDYINFPISAGAGDAITLNVLQKDYSLNILIVWNSTAPIMGATYQKESVFTATGNSNQSAYGILQSIAVAPSKMNDVNFKQSFLNVYLEIENAVQAQANADEASAQGALDRCYKLTSNQSFYF